MSQSQPSSILPEEDAVEDLHAQVTGLMKQRDMAIADLNTKTDQMNVLKGMYDAMKECLNEANRLKENYREEIVRLAMVGPMSTVVDKNKKLEADLKAAEELIAEFQKNGAVRYYREKMEDMQGEAATLKSDKETAFEFLKRSLDLIDGVLHDEYFNKVELLLWGPCDHDFGGKCPRCYPSMRK